MEEKLQGRRRKEKSQTRWEARVCATPTCSTGAGVFSNLELVSPLAAAYSVQQQYRSKGARGDHLPLPHP